MPVISVKMIGGFGNQLFQYAFARAYAEKHGCELQTRPWLGQKIFQIEDRQLEKQLPLRAEVELAKWTGDVNIEIDGYCMRQEVLLYSRETVRRWFTFRPAIQSILDNIPLSSVCAHLRDFQGLDGFVTVPKDIYLLAATRFGIDPESIRFVSENNAIGVPTLDRMSCGFLGDFYRLMKAAVLFRANSSFSWWAATLGNAKRVFAPNLQLDSSVEFVEGNWPSLSRQHWFCSDLHLHE